MRVGRTRTALLLVSVFSLLASATPAPGTQGSSGAAAPVVQERRAGAAPTETEWAAATKLATTEHAPVDGKDGLPKTGPWIETNAERERQKTKEVPDDPKTLSTFKHGLTEAIPESNDGVMDDPSRERPSEGTRGTEGGISQKSKEKAGTINDEKAKKPESPKEVSKAQQAEEEKTLKKDPSKEDKTTKAAKATAQDEKKDMKLPLDLPEKPYPIPPPENPSSPKDSTISRASALKDDKSTPKAVAAQHDAEQHEPAVIQPLHSLLLSFAMIIVSEIGDKTFLVACLMAMRHDRLLVFSAAFSALITMTVLSAVLGHAVPTLIPKNVTNFLAAVLFLVFGAKMLLEARKISPDEGVSEEMKEVEMELEEKEQRSARRMSRHHLHHGTSPHDLHILESGRAKHPGSPTSSASSSRSNSPTARSSFRLSRVMAGLNNLCGFLLSPAWVQTFVMTFLGEWGDRSQIATIAMAAGQDYWWVTAGAVGGHAICTGMAVIGGKAIAGKVSLRTVTLGGAIAFLIFGVIYLLEAVY